MAKILKFIQVNIYKGKYLDALVDFLKSEDPDFVSMQEVSSGVVNECADRKIDLFGFLGEKLKMYGRFSDNVALSDFDDSGLGNAVLSKLPIIDSKVEVLKDFRRLLLSELKDDKFWPEIKRSIVDVSVKINGEILHAMSVHGAWTAPPTDTNETARQAKLIASYLKSLGDVPFILGGDFNMPPEMKVIKIISGVANNLMLGSPFKYTTHPEVHKIVPRKLLVDYIFTSRHFKKISLAVPEVLVSDHLPVVAQLEFVP
ncbi:endonuclease/exonuclease/phosphatase family protein [Candidatus Curtissbacteria bacterium]|nr:endonuclease/exonuclease/phosphatase family protein [Candidatus Curtissbacteria bacterium]